MGDGYKGSIAAALPYEGSRSCTSAQPHGRRKEKVLRGGAYRSKGRLPSDGDDASFSRPSPMGPHLLLSAMPLRPSEPPLGSAGDLLDLWASVLAAPSSKAADWERHPLERPCGKRAVHMCAVSVLQCKNKHLHLAYRSEGESIRGQQKPCVVVSSPSGWQLRRARRLGGMLPILSPHVCSKSRYRYMSLF